MRCLLNISFAAILEYAPDMKLKLDVLRTSTLMIADVSFVSSKWIKSSISESGKPSHADQSAHATQKETALMGG